MNGKECGEEVAASVIEAGRWRGAPINNVAYRQVAALFAIAEALHAVADALKPGEKT